MAGARLGSAAGCGRHLERQKRAGALAGIIELVWSQGVALPAREQAAGAISRSGIASMRRKAANISSVADVQAEVLRLRLYRTC